MKKKWLSMLMVLNMVPALIAGCGSSSSKDGDSSNKESDKPLEIRVMAYNAESSRTTYLKMLD